MSTTINVGWLKDNNGDKFAPKTLSSQVILNDGISVDEVISQLSVEKITRPATAKVGQTIVVKEVDANGKPTKWEAVDMPSGGSGEPGRDGITPHIGANGNWFIGETDTGTTAQGDDYVLTDADKQEMVNAVISALPVYNGEIVDV